MCIFMTRIVKLCSQTTNCHNAHNIKIHFLNLRIVKLSIMEMCILIVRLNYIVKLRIDFEPVMSSVST